MIRHNPPLSHETLFPGEYRLIYYSCAISRSHSTDFHKKEDLICVSQLTESMHGGDVRAQAQGNFNEYKMKEI